MKWNRDRKRKFFAALKKSKDQTKTMKTGASCCFIRLSDTEGVKLFSDKWARDRSYRLQKRCSKYSLAPQVGGKFWLQCFDADNVTDVFVYRRLYGYVTEAARVRSVVNPTRMNNLHDRLCDIGVRHFDLYEDNVGFINGRLVCVDFDHASCSYGNEPDVEI